MNIAVAPYIPIIKDAYVGNIQFDNLSLFDLPTGVIFYVPEKWDEFLANCSGIAEDYELFSSLLDLPVEEVTPVKKAEYIKLNPDVLMQCNESDSYNIRQLLYALFLYKEGKRIYAGCVSSINTFTLSSDKEKASIVNYNPASSISLKGFIDSYIPRLTQLQHYKEGRKNGNRDISPFSAYDRNDEAYAKLLLRKAYEEHLGDIDDDTYLYTYDPKFKTFVEFRPNRNNEYHGMDISKEVARKKCPEIVKLYHK